MLSSTSTTRCPKVPPIPSPSSSLTTRATTSKPWRPWPPTFRHRGGSRVPYTTRPTASGIYLSPHPPSLQGTTETIHKRKTIHNTNWFLSSASSSSSSPPPPATSAAVDDCVRFHFLRFFRLYFKQAFIYFVVFLDMSKAAVELWFGLFVLLFCFILASLQFSYGLQIFSFIIRTHFFFQSLFLAYDYHFLDEM